jgi:predicted membrane channel-forming protein YqfA (hemolysin III family)
VKGTPSGVGDGDPNPSRDSDEDPDDRLNRELIELLNELRVMLPGVQVLFAFLLTVPFSSRFHELTNGQQAIYFATFVCTTIATGLFMVPTAYHRIRFRQGDKERILRTSNRFTIVGIVFLAIAITLAFVLISDALFGLGVAIALGAVVLVFLAWAWFAIPLSRRVRDSG